MIKQHVVLSGFASEHFTAEIDVLQKLRIWLDWFFPPGTLTQWMPAVVEGRNTLEFGNRLFTPSHLVQGAPEGYIYETALINVSWTQCEPSLLVYVDNADCS